MFLLEWELRSHYLLHQKVSWTNWTNLVGQMPRKRILTGSQSCQAKPISHNYFYILRSSCLKHLTGSEPRGRSLPWINFCWVCATGFSDPLPHYGLFCGQLQTPPQSPLGKDVIFLMPIQSLSTFMNRSDPVLRLNEEHFTFRLQCKHSVNFANRKYEELSCFQKSKFATPFY